MTVWQRPRIRLARPTLLGPVFVVELVRAARRRRLYLLRAVYALVLMGLVASAVASMENTRYFGRSDSLRRAAAFAETFYTTFAVVQLGVGCVLVAATASGMIADERQRRTLEFLFATDLTNREIVLGKFAVVMLSSVALLASAAPVIALTQLFGATPVDELARSTLVAVSTMAFVAAGCLLVSTLSTRPREAVVRAFVVAAILLFAPLLLIFLMIFRPDLYEWVQAPHQFLLDANPLVYWVRANWAGSAAFLPTLAGWEGVYNLAWNQGVMTTAFLAWTVLRVRAAYLKTANRAAVVKEKPSGRFSWRTVLRPGLDVLPPMLWKELFLQSTIRGMNRTGKVIAALVDASLFAVLAWFWQRSLVAKEEYLRIGFAEAMGFLSLAVAWVYLLVCATRAATSMTQERESGNWESLLSTRVSGAEIVVGKTLGAVLSLRILLLHVIAFMALPIWFFPEMRWHGLRMCLAILAASFVVSAVGVLCSIRATQSSRAILKTLAVAALFSGLLLIPVSLFEGPYRDHSELRILVEDASFIESLNWAAFYGGPRSWERGFRGHFGWNWAGLAIQVGIGLVFMTVAARRFDRWTGRAPQRASSSALQSAS